MRKSLVVVVMVAAAVVVALAAVVLWPSSGTGRRPVLVDVAPLQPVTRTSVVVAPVAITLSAVQEAMEAAAPHNLSGKRPGPLPEVLSGADIGFAVERGPLLVAGRPEGLVITTVLTGSFRATGQIAKSVDNLGSALDKLVGGGIAQQLQSLAGKPFDQRAEVRGNVTVTSRPAIMPAWRLEPNLAAKVTIADASIPIAGIKLSLANEVKPLVDRSVSEQIAALAARIRTDPFLELAARREWAKLCRAVSLGATGPGMTDLWLEIRPTRAFSAQPRFDATALTLVLGVSAETRITSTQTKPDCPFPAQLDIVAQTEPERLGIGVPIDLPFSEVNRLLEPQLTGRTFPEDGSGPVEVTIRSATLAASGDRLLITLGVKARERSLFSLGAAATVYVWGRPVLDPKAQILRLTDIELDVESEAAFGLLGAAARAALPYLKSALAERAVIDLKPFIATARKRLEAAVADFTRSDQDVRVDAAITDLRLVGIAFDAKTLRVIAEADGTARVAVTTLPGR